MNTAKILYFDIETAPEIAYIWKRWDENIGPQQVIEPGYVMCAGWAWNEGGVQSVALVDSPMWSDGQRKNDFYIVKAMWELLNEADIVVGHNVKGFDIQVLNGRFVVHGFAPPQNYKVVDTLEVLRRRFRLPANSLESATQSFGIEQKRKQGFELWSGCMNGSERAWADMVSYCRGDVRKTRELYKKIRPFDDRHPNLGLYEDDPDRPICVKCGSKKLQSRGLSMTQVNKFRRFQCMDCGGWSRSRVMEKPDRKNVLTNVGN